MIGYFEDCGRKVGAGGAYWHSLAAAQGHGQAQLSLALHLLRGGGPARACEAVMWLELAAGQGVAEAARRLDELEESGQGHAAGAGLRSAAASELLRRCLHDEAASQE
jgi:TPR repeat protein